MKTKLALVTICFFSAFLSADELFKPQEFVYLLKVFNGMGFSEINDDGSIYLLADEPNFIQIFLKAPHENNGALELESNVVLEIHGQDLVKKVINETNLIIHDQSDAPSKNWKVLQGRDMDVELEKIEMQMEEYNRNYQKYLDDFENYQENKKQILKDLRKFSQEEKSSSELMDVYHSLIEPLKPEKPFINDFFKWQAFYINLPEGIYQIHVTEGNNRIVDESRRNLVLFKPAKRDIVGYQIIPASIWSTPVILPSPKYIFYTDRHSDLYITPFYQNEYNDFYFSKSIGEETSGNPGQFRFVRTLELMNKQIEIMSSRQTQVVYEQVFELGTSSKLYNDKYRLNSVSKKNDEKTDSLRAFYVSLDDKQSYYKIRLQDEKGKYFQLSNREIRVVDAKNFPVVLYLFALVPLVIMFVLLFQIKRKNKKSF
ncbi:MAG: hypothetical protein JXR70_08345 [Spirochaetales bacterium]|nr:hypothetical protein [Spirochaetales bacterium]